MRKFRQVLVLITLLIFSGCNGYQRIDPALDQGQNWGKDNQKAFYQTSQGSQIIRYGWFLALEQPNGTDLFLADKLARYGYLPDLFPSAADYNPEQLPVGFVRDDDEDEDEKGSWIGMTCAACHTSELEFKGKTYRIDGAPTDADFYKFVSELSESLIKTEKDDDKFARFAARIESQPESFGVKYKGTDLRADLKKEAERFKGFVSRSTPRTRMTPSKPCTPRTPSKPDPCWGKARLDAFTLILNEVAYHVMPDEINLAVPNAPVSYPFLWDTHQQPRVQWNGVSGGELSRNTTEVLGVFAKFNPEEFSDNTVKLENLMDLEDLVEQLRSPRWKDFNFDEKNDQRLKDGAVLYEKHCQSCHKVYKRDEDQVRTVDVCLNPMDDTVTPKRKKCKDLRPINTDKVMAKDFYKRRVILEQGGERKEPLKALRDVLPGVWLKSFYAFLVGVFQGLLGESPEEVRVYKARPLNGVWATAPYLHNGSVPNMMELLKPEDERISTFCVGSREFDPVNLGFEFRPDANGNCGENFLFDTAIKGNRNKGHDYGNKDFSEADRLAIIEFIKWE